MELLASTVPSLQHSRECSECQAVSDMLGEESCEGPTFDTPSQGQSWLKASLASKALLPGPR